MKKWEDGLRKLAKIRGTKPEWKPQNMLERDLYKKLYDAALQRLCDINAAILPTALKNTQTPTTQLCRAE